MEDLLEVLDACIPTAPFVEGQPKVADRDPKSEHAGTPGMMPEGPDAQFEGGVLGLGCEALVHNPCS